MSYSSYDSSVKDGAPIECFKFIGELGTYWYTNNNEPVTVNGEVYSPLSGIKRTALETSSLLDSVQTIDITIPITCPLAVIYNFLKMPVTLDTEIRSVHRGSNFATDWRMVWRGESLRFNASGNYAMIATQSVVQAALGSQLNQVTFQTPCNHTVYDELCTLSPVAFTTTTTVTDIKDTVIQVVSDGNPDGKLAVGKMVNTRTGESRVIVSNVANVITIGYGFLDIVLGDTVQLIIGCDNAYSTCLNVFNNVINFSGFMFLPTTNPYIDEV